MAATPKMEEIQYVAIDMEMLEITVVPNDGEETTTGEYGEEDPLMIAMKKKLEKVPGEETTTEENDGEETTTGEHGEEDPLMISMKKKLEKVPGEPLKDRNVTIFRLPAWFHETGGHLWGPKIVPIGPYHHGKEIFRAIEEHKWSHLRDFLARNNIRLEVCLQKMRNLEKQARECYSETLDMESDEFTMMLLVDGCFILEWFLKGEIDEADVICDAGWALVSTMTDLLLFENQIPFVVIKTLFFIRDGESHNCDDNCPLIKLIFLLQNVWRLTIGRVKPQISCSNIQHLAHYIYTAIMVGAEETVITDVDETEMYNLYNLSCVGDLYEAGVKFRKKESPRCRFDITFENGIMEIPFVRIDDANHIIFWNMVAFERSQRSKFKPILLAYLHLMDKLINTEKDVAILQRCGVFEHYFPSDEDAAARYNQFTKYFVTFVPEDYFKPLHKKIKAYSESTWHQYRAKLMRDYFSNPWSIISLVAATILLTLTFTQTIYSANDL